MRTRNTYEYQSRIFRSGIVQTPHRIDDQTDQFESMFGYLFLLLNGLCFRKMNVGGEFSNILRPRDGYASSDDHQLIKCFGVQIADIGYFLKLLQHP